jgi:hypothetical protein
MSGTYNAPVFNQPDRAFDFASEGVRLDPSRPERLRVPLDANAPGLRNYLASYAHALVDPFIEQLARRGAVEMPGQTRIAFDLGAFATFKMIYDVYQNTGAELPDLSYNFPDVPAEADEPNMEPGTPLLDVYYRGTEFQERLPHVFAASILMTPQVMGRSKAGIGSDLYSFVDMLDDPEMAWRELHFVAGAAETALTIEERAALR